MSVIDHPALTEKYFFPRPDAPPAAGSVMVPAADGVSQLHCWRSAPHAEGPTLVHFHGNGEVVADFVPGFAETINAMGANLLLAEYRGYGGSGGEVSLSAILDDTEAIYAYLVAEKVPEERIVAFGRSLGSYCAIEMAATHARIGGVILDSSIADPVERILMRIAPEDVDLTLAELEAEIYVRLDHERKLNGFRGPLLVLHAANDSMVDVSHAERNHLWGGGYNKQLVLLPNGDHNSVMAANHEAFFGAVATFLHRI